jgi:hypothetical protein
MDAPASSSVNSDRAQISISGQDVQNGRAATPAKPPNGKDSSATPHRSGRSERPIPNINNLTEDVMSTSDAGAPALQAYRIHLRSDEFQFENEIHASQVDREDGWTVFWNGNDVFLRVRDEHIVSLEHLD